MEILTNTFARGKNSAVHTTLKNVWNMAICVAGKPGNHLSKVAPINPGQINSTVINNTAPKVLNMRCISAALRAFVPVPIDDISAVTQVPMLVPSTT